jgi:hypothetical protein
VTVSLIQLAAIGTVVFTAVNFIRFALDGDKSSAGSQVLAWASGIGAALIVAHTDLAAAFVFGAKPLNQLNLVSQGLVGLMAASSISVVNEVKKAIDNTDSARVPPLRTSRARVQIPRKAYGATPPDRSPAASR